MNELVSIIICILSFVLALVSVITVIITLRQNAKQIAFNNEQLEEMRKEHMLSLQPLLMSENPVFKIERPRTFYSPPEKKFSIQSRYFLNLDVRNVTKAAAVFVDAEAKLIVDTLDKKKSERATTARTNILASEEKACIHFMFVDDVDDLVYSALRERNQRLLPKVEVVLYYKNTSGGCFKTTSVYTVALDESNGAEVKDWHTFLDSVGIRYKEELDKMKREGDAQGVLFNAIKMDIDKTLGEVKTINLKCYESIEEFRYISISQEDYDKAHEGFRYPLRILGAPYSLNCNDDN